MKNLPPRVLKQIPVIPQLLDYLNATLPSQSTVRSDRVLHRLVKRRTYQMRQKWKKLGGDDRKLARVTGVEVHDGKALVQIKTRVVEKKCNNNNNNNKNSDRNNSRSSKKTDGAEKEKEIKRNKTKMQTVSKVLHLVTKNDFSHVLSPHAAKVFRGGAIYTGSNYGDGKPDALKQDIASHGLGIASVQNDSKSGKGITVIARSRVRDRDRNKDTPGLDTRIGSHRLHDDDDDDDDGNDGEEREDEDKDEDENGDDIQTSQKLSKIRFGAGSVGYPIASTTVINNTKDALRLKYKPFGDFYVMREPFLHVPEIALMGRSNVGKSSLLNRIAGCGMVLAKHSLRPGTTRRISRFELISGKLALLDLPGYGFSYGGPAWWEHAAEFLKSRKPVLKRIVILLDARHGLKIEDHKTLLWIKEHLPNLNVQFLFTKADLVQDLRDIARRISWANIVCDREQLISTWRNDDLVQALIYQGQGTSHTDTTNNDGVVDRIKNSRAKRGRRSSSSSGRSSSRSSGSGSTKNDPPFRRILVASARSGEGIPEVMEDWAKLITEDPKATSDRSRKKVKGSVMMTKRGYYQNIS